MTPFDPKIHHRRSMRLEHYDYSQTGAYFITLVTYRRDEIFGEIINSEMHLSPLGRVVREEWMRSIEIRKEIRLNGDEFIIMPNHIHGIVWITTVGADGVRPDSGVRPNDGSISSNLVPDNPGACHRVAYPVGNAPLPRPQNLLLPHQMPGSLSSFVAGFKASVTKRARLELKMNAIWQRNFYDHIIRDEKDFTNIWQYIDDNPRRWLEDQLHPFAPMNRLYQE